MTEETAKDALKTLISDQESLELAGLVGLNERYSKLRRDFEVIATGSGVNAMALEEAKPLDLKSELNELVEPWWVS